MLFPLYAGDMEPAILLPSSILREGNMTFNEFVKSDEPLPYWFMQHGEDIVSVYPLIPGLLNVPVSGLAYIGVLPHDVYQDRYLLSRITAVLIAAGAVVLMYWCLGYIVKTKDSAALLALTYAFATNVWSTAGRGLWQHGPSLLFLNAAVFLILRNKKREVPWIGVLTGLLVWNRPTNIVFALAITFFFLWKRPKQFLHFVMPLGGIALLFGWYSVSFYGSLFALGQGQPFSGFSADPLPTFLALLISPGRGLFVFTPFFLFAIVACVMLLRKSHTTEQEHLFLLLGLSSVMLVSIYSFWGEWWGGVLYGYRIITEMVTPLMLLTAWWYAHASWQKSFFLRSAWVITLFIAVVVQYIGTVGFPCETDEEKAALQRDGSLQWSFHESSLVRCGERMLFIGTL